MSRIFTGGTNLYDFEVMMTAVPNFLPRASGAYIYKSHKNPEAGKCTYCADTDKVTGCKHKFCPYIYERAELGTIDYRTLLSDTFNNIDNARFSSRLDALAIESTSSVFLNAEHRYRFEIIVRKLKNILNKPTSRFLASIYLLTTSKRLWDMVSEHIIYNDIDFSKIKLYQMDTDTYTCYLTAKSFLKGKPKIRLSELIDRNTISDNAFKLIINSILIINYGVDILYLEY